MTTREIVRTLNKVTKLKNLKKEMKRLRMDALWELVKSGDRKENLMVRRLQNNQFSLKGRGQSGVEFTMNMVLGERVRGYIQQCNDITDKILS